LLKGDTGAGSFRADPSFSAPGIMLKIDMLNITGRILEGEKPVDMAGVGGVLDIDRIEAVLGDAKRHRPTFVIAAIRLLGFSRLFLTPSATDSRCGSNNSRAFVESDASNWLPALAIRAPSNLAGGSTAASLMHQRL
jgi:hypothetical protein